MKLSGVMEFVVDLYILSTKKHLTLRKRLHLFFSYLNIRIKRLFLGKKLVSKKNIKQSFLGFHIKVSEFSDFYWTFREIFIREDYTFDSDKKNPTIIDLGGNIGMSVLYFKWLYPESKITVFEALPENVKILRENIKKNNLKNIDVIEKAVGGKNGKIIIRGSKRAASISQNFVNKQNNSVGSGIVGEEIKVKLTTLSQYVKNEVDLLKIDIEGAECDVLNELSKEDRLKNINCIAMEYHFFSENENLLVDILNLLKSSKFKIVCNSDFKNLRSFPKREYYNFMIFAKKM